MALAAVPESQLPNVQIQADFYAKLSRLQDEVLARKHPRLSLPSPVLKQLATVVQSSQATLLQNAPYNPSAESTSSIDPVHSTRSAEVVRAEVNLNRQRLEKLLAQAVEQKRVHDSARRQRDRVDKDHIIWDAPHDFDTSKVLKDALDRVKPVSGWAPVAANPPSPESAFNENEYYSSQVMSSTTSTSGRSSGHDATVETLVDPTALRAQGAAFDALSIASSSQRDESYSPPAADAFQHPAASAGLATQFLPPMLVPPPPPPSQFPVSMPPNMIPGLMFSQHAFPQPVLPRTRESESYSPPAPLAASLASNGYVSTQPIPQHGQNGSSAQSRNQKNKKDRADAKARKQKRKEQQQQQQAELQATSGISRGQVTGSASTIQNPRKRRREAEGPAEDSQRRASGKRIARTVVSPMPFIKPEPLSPPPLSVDLPPSNEPPRRLVLREDGRADIQVESPRQKSNRAQKQRDEFYAGYISDEDLPSPRYAQRTAEPAPYPSPGSRRRMATAPGNDLRRVASYQHAMRPASPTAYASYPADDMGYIRAPSRMVSVRPPSRVPEYYDELQPFPQLRPSQRRPPFYETLDEPPPVSSRMADRYMMPPPMPSAKRRIVVDEFGDEWVAVRAPSSVRQSVVPSTPYDMPAQPYARAQSTRLPEQPLMRVRQQPQRVVDLEEDDLEYSPRHAVPLQPSSRQRILRGGEDMPPPPMPPPMPMPVRHPSRAASMAPQVLTRDPYHRANMAFGYDMDAQPERMRPAMPLAQHGMLARSFSTRPDFEQQQRYAAGGSGESAEYDPRAPTMLWQQR